MKLSFSTNAFTRVPLDDALEAIARIGYSGAEIMADRPHLWPPDVDADRVAALKAKAAELGIALCNINGFTMKAVGDMHHPSWIETDEEARDARVKHTLACLELARGLGIPFVSTEPGGPVHGTIEMRGKEYALFARMLDRVVPRAEELGVTLLIEPEPGLLFEDMDSVTAFLENMDTPALGVNFDAGHFYCIGDDPAGLVNAFGSFLKHVHIEDIAADRVHKHLIPGRGAMDFGKFFDALKRRNYKGFVTVELYPYDETPEQAAEEAYKFLRPYFEGEA
jgi:sugar phosphate isomerase/epimerase